MQKYATFLLKDGQLDDEVMERGFSRVLYALKKLGLEECLNKDGELRVNVTIGDKEG